MHFVWEEFSPKENASYGEELAKSAAHLAVRDLWARRLKSGMTQEQIAASIGKDPAWLSRVMKGPANWTLKTLGALVVALDGKLNIQVEAVEDNKGIMMTNFDAYHAQDPSYIFLPDMVGSIDAGVSKIHVHNGSLQNKFEGPLVATGVVS